MQYLAKQSADGAKPAVEPINESFFIDDEFYDDIYHYAESMDGEIEDLEDDWAIQVTACELQPLVTLTPDWIVERICEERFSEDNSDQEYEKIIKALKQCIDFDKLNSLMPKLNYATREKYFITKTDLLEAISWNN